jgi:hypothetical protein
MRPDEEAKQRNERKQRKALPKSNPVTSVLPISQQSLTASDAITDIADVSPRDFGVLSGQEMVTWS